MSSYLRMVINDPGQFAALEIYPVDIGTIDITDRFGHLWWAAHVIPDTPLNLPAELQQIHTDQYPLTITVTSEGDTAALH